MGGEREVGLGSIRGSLIRGRLNIPAEVRPKWNEVSKRERERENEQRGRSGEEGEEGEWKKKLLAGSQWVRAASRIPRAGRRHPPLGRTELSLCGSRVFRSEISRVYPAFGNSGP